MKVLIVNAFCKYQSHTNKYRDFFKSIQSQFSKFRQILSDIKYIEENLIEISKYIYLPDLKYTDRSAIKVTSIQLFDSLDFIFVVGEFNVLPWHKKAKELQLLINQAKRTNKPTFLSGYPILQLVKSCSNVLVIDKVLNSANDIFQEEISQVNMGEVIINKITGDILAFNTEKQEFYPVGNLGFHNHKAAEESSLYKDAMLSSNNVHKMQPYKVLKNGRNDETTVLVERQCMQHWLVKDIGPSEFIVNLYCAWDIHPVNIMIGGDRYKVLADTPRGAGVILYKNIAATYFHILTQYPNTVKILQNFINYFTNQYISSQENFSWNLEKINIVLQQEKPYLIMKEAIVGDSYTKQLCQMHYRPQSASRPRSGHAISRRYSAQPIQNNAILNSSIILHNKKLTQSRTDISQEFNRSYSVTPSKRISQTSLKPNQKHKNSTQRSFLSQLGPSLRSSTPYQTLAEIAMKEQNLMRKKWKDEKGFRATGRIGTFQKQFTANFEPRPSSSHKYREVNKKKWIAGPFKVAPYNIR